MKFENLTVKIFKTAPVLLIITSAILLRLLPHPANVAPIGVMALFGGVYLNKRYALILPLSAMVISDFFLGFSQSTLFVYLCFALTGIVGMWLKKRKTVFHLIGASLFSSFLFFLVTNFGYWLTYSLYPKTFEGQLLAYYYALPFFRNSVFGDLLYAGFFFGGYEVIRAYLAARGVKKISTS